MKRDKKAKHIERNGKLLAIPQGVARRMRLSGKLLVHRGSQPGKGGKTALVLRKRERMMSVTNISNYTTMQTIRRFFTNYLNISVEFSRQRAQAAQAKQKGWKGSDSGKGKTVSEMISSALKVNPLFAGQVGSRETTLPSKTERELRKLFLQNRTDETELTAFSDMVLSLKQGQTVSRKEGSILFSRFRTTILKAAMASEEMEQRKENAPYLLRGKGTPPSPISRKRFQANRHIEETEHSFLRKPDLKTAREIVRDTTGLIAKGFRETPQASSMNGTQTGVAPLSHATLASDSALISLEPAPMLREGKRLAQLLSGENALPEQYVRKEGTPSNRGIRTMRKHIEAKLRNKRWIDSKMLAMPSKPSLAAEAKGVSRNRFPFTVNPETDDKKRVRPFAKLRTHRERGYPFPVSANPSSRFGTPDRNGVPGTSLFPSATEMHSAAKGETSEAKSPELIRGTLAWNNVLGKMPISRTTESLKQGNRELAQEVGFAYTRNPASPITPMIPVTPMLGFVYKRNPAPVQETVRQTKQSLATETVETHKTVANLTRAVSLGKEEELENVAEKVYDILEKRLLIETERRGMR